MQAITLIVTISSHSQPARQLTSLQDWHSQLQLHGSVDSTGSQRRRKQPKAAASAQLNSDKHRRDVLTAGGTMLSGMLCSPLQVHLDPLGCSEMSRFMIAGAFMFLLARINASAMWVENSSLRRAGLWRKDSLAAVRQSFRIAPDQDLSSHCGECPITCLSRFCRSSAGRLHCVSNIFRTVCRLPKLEHTASRWMASNLRT